MAWDRLDDLAADALSLVPDRGRTILALAGPPGAGKSTLAIRLVEAVNRAHTDAVCGYVPLDGFHLSNRQLERLERTDRKGAMHTFDVWGYVALLRRLLVETDRPIYVPDYDRRLHEPIAARHVVEPVVRLIVTEGNYLASGRPGWREVGELASQVWYVSAAAQLRERRLIRRQLAGGRNSTEARSWVDNNDLVNTVQVETDLPRCDRVVAVAPGDR